jgi:hypothetical protein
MTPSSPESAATTLVKEINAAVLELVGAGLVDKYYSATLQRRPNELVVSSPIAIDASVIKKRPYLTIYNEQIERRAFTIMFLDGAIAQISYRFDDAQLLTHRLAYLPAPDLEPYQTDPGLYIQGVHYLEAVGHQVVAVPLRFDFDARAGVSSEDHPLSHLTLGQYKHCRIPVSGPLAPAAFLDFIVRSFYTTPSHAGPALTQNAIEGFTDTISENQRARSHFVVPFV